jgi:hypothetical protein
MSRRRSCMYVAMSNSLYSGFFRNVNPSMVSPLEVILYGTTSLNVSRKYFFMIESLLVSSQEIVNMCTDNYAGVWS